MTNSKIGSVDNRLYFFKKIIISNIFGEDVKETDIPEEFRDDLPSCIVKKNGKIIVKPWLKARLFEIIIASEGMDEYLKELLGTRVEKPEDIPINVFLASSLISASVNPFSFELINQSIRKEIDLSKHQIDNLSHIFRPRKDFTISRTNAIFNSKQVQNIKNVLLGKSLDILSAYEKYKYLDSMKGSRTIETIPSDLKRISSIPNFDIEQLMLISQKYKTQLRLSFVDGYLIWEFGDNPVLFIKANHVYYSPKYSQSKGVTSYRQADRQSYHLIEQFEATHLPSTSCSVCGERFTSKLFYHLDKGVVPVCNECAKSDQKVAGFVARISYKI